MPTLITKENFSQEVTDAKQPVILDFFATWCGPCQQMEPIFAEVEQSLGDKYKFAKLDVDESRELSIQFGVTSVPTFLFLKDNQVVGKTMGYMSKEALEEKIKEALE